MMGRKRAPQPLSLGDTLEKPQVHSSATSLGCSHSSTSLSGSNGPSPIIDLDPCLAASAAPRTSLSANATGLDRNNRHAFGHDGHSHSSHSFDLGPNPSLELSIGAETSLRVVPSSAPPVPRCPKPPLSPYSKFNKSRKALAQLVQDRSADTAKAQSQTQLQTKPNESHSQMQPQTNPTDHHTDASPNSPSSAATSSPTLETSRYLGRYAQQDFEPRPKSQPQTQAQTHAQLRSKFSTSHVGSSSTTSSHRSNQTSVSSASKEGANPTTKPGKHQRQPTRDGEREKHTRNASRFFNFNKSSKALHQVHSPQNSQNFDIRSTSSKSSQQTDKTEVTSTDKAISIGPSHPDSALSGPTQQHSAPFAPFKSNTRLVSGSGSGDQETANPLKKNKPKPFPFRGRSKSIKDIPSLSEKESEVGSEPEMEPKSSSQQALKPGPSHTEGADQPSPRPKMDSSSRTPSADRAGTRTTNKDTRSAVDKEYSSQSQHNRSHPSSYKDNGGSTFFNGLKNSGSRAADMLSRNIFGKGGKGASTMEKEPIIDDEHYQLKVINKPLKEQTRLTRISKRLEDSKDKTEFWMPAFPWRAIDYLNYKGSNVEGLYRVPGSGPQIKKWQRRFDEELDLDLFAQPDLYDINIIGSMLKAWLRELPDELLPKEAQDRIARQTADTDSEEVPKQLIEELSNLPPFNYYLLFAITCHLSLLLAHSDKNKMDFRNLCICFQPCMKMDASCFRFLVCEWRSCWQGCRNEARYIEEEYAFFEQPPPRTIPPRSATGSPQTETNASTEDGRDDASSGSRPSLSKEEPRGGKSRRKPVGSGQPSEPPRPADSVVETVLSVDEEREHELRRLSPIKPLSPLGF